MSAVAVDKAGVGSAVLNSSRQVGGSLGIAVMGAIVASATLQAATRRTRRSCTASTTRCASARCSASPARSSRSLAIRKIEHHGTPSAPSAAASRRRDRDARQRLTGGRAAAGGARHRLPRLLALELPRRDDGRDRARGGHLRADPLPPLRLEARPLPRVPRRGVARASARTREQAIARRPARCLGAIADAYMAKDSRSSASSTSGSRR